MGARATARSWLPVGPDPLSLSLPSPLLYALWPLQRTPGRHNPSRFLGSQLQGPRASLPCLLQVFTQSHLNRKALQLKTEKNSSSCSPL